MSRDEFLLLNAVVVIIVLVVLLRLRKQDQPSRLDLKGRKRLDSDGETGYQNVVSEVHMSGNGQEKSLNVHFQYNGETWDAHEVLGVPAGAPLETVKKQFDQVFRAAASDKRPFLQTAFQAIVAMHKKP